MNTVFCFGELLLRLSPRLGGEWIQQSLMPVFMGGAELNVATALAKWGVPVHYATALPDHYLSKEIIAFIEQKGIGTRHVVFCGDRIGTYYLPQGADMKTAGVIYDRAHSSFSELQPGQIDWSKALKGVDWFHISAINPALSENLALVCKEAVEEAVKQNIFISLDLNYRAKLWQYGKDPREVMPELVFHANLVMGNIWAAEKMLGIPVNSNLLNHKEAYLEQSQNTSLAIVNAFPKCEQVAHTFRFDSEVGLTYYATLFSESQLYVSAQHQTKQVVDRVGSGDCFMAGLIFGNEKKWKPQEIINFATDAAFQKLFIKGDATTASVEEIKGGFKNYA